MKVKKAVVPSIGSKIRITKAGEEYLAEHDYHEGDVAIITGAQFGFPLISRRGREGIADPPEFMLALCADWYAAA